jgi:hypothetical protein
MLMAYVLAVHLKSNLVSPFEIVLLYLNFLLNLVAHLISPSAKTVLEPKAEDPPSGPKAWETVILVVLPSVGEIPSLHENRVKCRALNSFGDTCLAV